MASHVVTSRRRRRGLISVETALITPLLLLMAFGIIEYGWMFMKASQVSDAARRGARSAVVPDVTSISQVTSPSEDPTPAAIVVLNDAGIPVRANTVTVPTGVSPGVGNVVTVVVTVPYEDVELMGLPFIPTPEVLRVSVSMAKEGPG